MVTDLWTFVYPNDYNQKIKLWPIKSKNEGAVTQFFVCFVHRCDMGPLGPVASICATPAKRQTNRWRDGWTAYVRLCDELC